MAKMTKKKLTTILGYVLLLVHNGFDLEEVVSKEQFDEVMKRLEEIFEHEEEKAIKYISNELKKHMKEINEILEEE